MFGKQSCWSNFFFGGGQVRVNLGLVSYEVPLFYPTLSYPIHYPIHYADRRKGSHHDIVVGAKPNIT